MITSIHYFKIGTASKNEKGANSISDIQFEANGAASSGPPEEELLMWKPESTTTHNLEILRNQINEKYGNINLENYYDLHRYVLGIFQ